MKFELLDQLRELTRRVAALERQVTAVPNVVARYRTDAGQNILNNSAPPTLIDFEDQVYDPYSAVTTGASWNFAAPVAGYYWVAVNLVLATTTAWASNEYAYIYAYRNGSAHMVLAHTQAPDTSGASGYLGISGCGIIQLDAAETIEIRVQQTSGGTRTLTADQYQNGISIARVY